MKKPQIPTMIHWHVESDTEYSPMIICTSKGWKFNAGVKFTVSGIEFFAAPGLEEVSLGFHTWRITDGTTGGRVFESPPIPKEDVDEMLDDVITMFVIHLATQVNGNVEVLKSKQAEYVALMEKKFGPRPTSFPKELIESIARINNITLQTGEIVH